MPDKIPVDNVYETEIPILAELQKIMLSLKTQWGNTHSLMLSNSADWLTLLPVLCNGWLHLEDKVDDQIDKRYLDDVLGSVFCENLLHSHIL